MYLFLNTSKISSFPSLAGNMASAFNQEARHLLERYKTWGLNIYKAIVPKESHKTKEGFSFLFLVLNSSLLVSQSCCWKDMPLRVTFLPGLPHSHIPPLSCLFCFVFPGEWSTLEFKASWLLPFPKRAQEFVILWEIPNLTPLPPPP